MAKFLDKKEQVIDFQLTPYGKHRLSVGLLKPSYYAFFDTSITYDSEYTGYPGYSGFKESQNKIHERIKTETQFIEGILLFEEAENSVPPSTFIGEINYDTETFELGVGGASVTISEEVSRTSLFDLDVVPQRHVPKPEVLSFDSAIGDAKFEGDNVQAAPAWKVIACQGEMSNIKTRDTTQYNITPADFDHEITEYNIPQIDVAAYYTLLISKPTEALQEETVSEFVTETSAFAGGNTIKLVRDDIVIYGEEVNTELLTENFDVEVFEMIEDVGAEEAAVGIIYVGSSGPDGHIDVGDTITISDGLSTVIFEFIDNTSADAIRASGFPPGRIGVVVSSNYVLTFGSGYTQKGTIYNLLSALKQDSGLVDMHGVMAYPTDWDRNNVGDTTKGRCLPLFADYNGSGCYIGKHNLNIAINNDVIEDLYLHTFTGTTAQYELKIVNTNTSPFVDPNRTMTTTAASARIAVDGFTGGYTRKGVQLKRKYFNDANPQIIDGLMVAANPEAVQQPDLTTDAVEFFFDLLTDSNTNGKIACNCARTFNKNSYYVDIDFDCTEEEFDEVYYDIYGSATAPEICDLPPTTIQELRDLQPTEGPCEDE